MKKIDLKKLEQETDFSGVEMEAFVPPLEETPESESGVELPDNWMNWKHGNFNALADQIMGAIKDMKRQGILKGVKKQRTREEHIAQIKDIAWKKIDAERQLDIIDS